MTQGNNSGSGSGTGIDTGTGGFPVDVDGATVAYTYDTGTNANANAPKWSPGKISVDNSNRDISGDSKRTLAGYLSKTTLGQVGPGRPIPRNSYPIVHDAGDDPQGSSLRDVSGYPHPLSVISQEQPAFEKSLPASRSNDSVNLSILRGSQAPTAGTKVNGNELLKAAVDNLSNPAPNKINLANLSPISPVAPYVNGIITKNQYSTDSKFELSSNPNLNERINLLGQLSLLREITQVGISPMSTGNFYPVDIPQFSSNATSTNISKVSLSYDGYPAQLRSFQGDTQDNFRDLETGRSSDSTVLNILRGREKPTTNRSEDGNSLLRFAAKVLAGAINPPGAGTVNFTTLSDDTPIKPYLDGIISKNQYQYISLFQPSYTGPLRPSETLDTQPLSDPDRQDISQTKRRTYLKFLSDSTFSDDGRNAFQILNIPSRNDEKLRDEHGNPVPLHSVGDDTYIEHGLLSGRGKNVDGLLIGKNATTGVKNSGDNSVSGNKLLKDATPLPEGSINPTVLDGSLPPITSTAINSNSPLSNFYLGSVNVNRFGPDRKFGEGPNNPLNKDSGLYAKSYTLGESLPPGSPLRNVSYGRLAQIGSVLSLRAGLELGSLDPQFTPSNPGVQAEAILPGAAQLGVLRLERDQLNAENIIENLPEAAIGQELLIDPAGKSWGTLNNVLDEFSGISAIGMQTLAITLLIGMLLTILVFFGLFKWGGGGEERRALDNLGRFAFGSSVYDSSATVDPNNILSIISNFKKLNFWRLLGITRTDDDMSDCVATGGLAFFGVGDYNGTFSGAASEALKATVPVTSAPGYYSIVARTVTRSFLLITDYFTSLGKAFNSGLTAGIKQLMGLLDVLKNSKFFRILNVFAQAGNQIRNNGRDPEQIDTNSAGPGRRFKTSIDKAPENEYGKSRLTISGIYEPVSSKSTFRAKDKLLGSFLVETGMRSLQGVALSPTFLPAKGYKEGGTKDVNVSGPRISSKDRENFENALEAEYLPFYFHDVRTNEIVSFHAFLTSLTDNFSVAYDSVDAFGRAEPIKIYKSTTRKVGVSFMVAAMSDSDFDSMWLKINKLTTMVYPQFDSGKQLSSGGNKFTIPFSQLMKAPPFIRMRIGDLISSNYSKFNLARLFGFDSPKSELDGVSFSQKGRSDQLNAELKRQIEAVREERGTKFLIDKENSASLQLDGAKPENLQATSPHKDDSVHSIVFTVEEIIEKKQAEDTQWVKGSIVASSSDGKVLDKYSGKNYVIPIGRLDNPVNEKVLIAKAKAKVGFETKSEEFVSKVESFMNDSEDSSKGNAISRSFRSAGGKGLGGFIDSINFDWYDKVTWNAGYEESPKGDDGGYSYQGRRAPKMCKITISFNPVHDIAPGLDDNGINRAPVYNVRQRGTPRRIY